jgi:hypothetical protein
VPIGGIGPVDRRHDFRLRSLPKAAVDQNKVKFDQSNNDIVTRGSHAMGAHHVNADFLSAFESKIFFSVLCFLTCWELLTSYKPFCKPFKNLGARKTLGAYVMKMHRSFKFLTAALMLTAAPWIVTSTLAAPISSSLELQNADPSSIETVQYVYEWNGAYRRADRRANRWDRRAYRRGYGYDGYNAYTYAPGYGYRGYNAYAYAPGATTSYDYGSEPIAVSNRRTCLTEYAGREELCGFYGALYRRTYQ